MTINIVDFPIKPGDVPSLFVCLPGRVSPKKSRHATVTPGDDSLPASILCGPDAATCLEVRPRRLLRAPGATW